MKTRTLSLKSLFACALAVSFSWNAAMATETSSCDEVRSTIPSTRAVLNPALENIRSHIPAPLLARMNQGGRFTDAEGLQLEGILEPIIERTNREQGILVDAVANFGINGLATYKFVAIQRSSLANQNSDGYNGVLCILTMRQNSVVQCYAVVNGLDCDGGGDLGILEAF